MLLLIGVIVGLVIAALAKFTTRPASRIACVAIAVLTSVTAIAARNPWGVTEAAELTLGLILVLPLIAAVVASWRREPLPAREPETTPPQHGSAPPEK